MSSSVGGDKVCSIQQQLGQHYSWAELVIMITWGICHRLLLTALEAYSEHMVHNLSLDREA